MNEAFFIELKRKLAQSDTPQRQVWAKIIIDQDLQLADFSDLLLKDRRTAMRFAWLLSEVGQIQPGKLLRELPYFLKMSEKVKSFPFRTSFAFYWLITSVPEENEGEAIGQLFEFLEDPKMQVTIKSRSAFVLQTLCLKYPEMKPELCLIPEDQASKNTADFAKRAGKIIKELSAP